MSDLCYTYIKTRNEIGVIRRGETGYYKTDIAECNKIGNVADGMAFVEELNQSLGLTLGEVRSMEAGSMFGWECPAADPAHWNDDGTPII